MRLWLLLTTLGICAACTDPGISVPDASVDAPYPYPEPKTDVVSQVGTDSTLDVATWNIEHFPIQSDTASLVADLIASMALDIIVVQEVENTAGYDELIARLRGYEGFLSTHVYSSGTYQKLAIIYKTSEVELADALLLFASDAYSFPRPPVAGTVKYNGHEFTLMGVHLKAGFDGSDFARRESAMNSMLSYATNQLNLGKEILFVGDYNASLTSQESWGMWLNDNRFQVLSQPLDENGDYSFIPSNSLIDHSIASATLSTSAVETVIPNLNNQVTNYVSQVSDHLPVVTRFNLPPSN